MLGLPGGSAGKEYACNAGDLGWIPGLTRSPGEGKGYPSQYSSLGNSMGCIVRGAAESQTRPSNFHFTQMVPVVKNPPGNAGDKRCGFNPWVGKIPWRREWQPSPVCWPGVPWTEEPGGIQSMGSQRVRHG